MSNFFGKSLMFLMFLTLLGILGISIATFVIFGQKLDKISVGVLNLPAEIQANTSYSETTDNVEDMINEEDSGSTLPETGTKINYTCTFYYPARDMGGAGRGTYSENCDPMNTRKTKFRVVFTAKQPNNRRITANLANCGRTAAWGTYETYTCNTFIFIDGAK